MGFCFCAWKSCNNSCGYLPFDLRLTWTYYVVLAVFQGWEAPSRAALWHFRSLFIKPLLLLKGPVELVSLSPRRVLRG
jgi:hypothetical protein